MKKWFARPVALVMALVLILAVFTGYSAYDFYRYRPERIQKQLLGRVEARGSDLERFHPDLSGFGYGTIVWEYRLDRERSDRLSRSCIRNDRGRCVLGGTTDRESRDIFITWEDGKLRVEEWWY